MRFIGALIGLARRYSAADSRFAGRGAFGVPVVATEQMGTPEMIVDGETGRLVRSGDASALADALVDALRDPDAAERRASAARLDVERRFTWDHVVDRMTPALESFGSGRSR